MSESPILLARHGRVGLITLNRPAQLNALNDALMDALGEALLDLDRDPDIGAIVITGSDKAFAAGADIAVMADWTYMDVYQGQFITRNWETIRQVRKPVIAAVAGYAMGGGCELALACDIVIAAESSRFGAPIKNLGLVMAYSEMGPIASLLGPSKALEILLEGRIFDAQEALRIGLVSRVVPDHLVAQEVQAAAQRVASGAPLVARWHKKFARRLGNPTPLTAAEKDECFDCFDTEDFRIGYTAFLAKAPPKFVGR